MVHRLVLGITFLCLGLGITSGGPAALQIGDPADLFRIENLPWLRHYRTYMASSRDVEGGNFDWANYARTEGSEGVVLDVQGSGIITRIWSANPEGIIRLYIDGHSRPAVEEAFVSFLKRLPMSFGSRDPSQPASHEPGGMTSYFPIAFQRGCKLTLSPVPAIYYQVNYLLFDEPHSIKSFSATQLESAAVQYKGVAADLDWDPRAPRRAEWRYQTGTAALPPGKSAVVFDRPGPMTIRQITFSVPWPAIEAQAACAKSNLLLRGYWDEDLTVEGLPGRRIASIKAPLALFFMDAGSSSDYGTTLVARQGNLYSCRFPMPVQQRAVLELTNNSPLDLGELEYTIAYEPASAADLPPTHFKAIYHSEDSTFGPDLGNYRDQVMYLRSRGEENYPLLKVRGEGHIIGCCFDVDLSEMPYTRSAGESDEAVFVDDDPQRTMWGTGNEDYVNDAWGFHDVAGRLSGGRTARAQMFGYRFHVSDAIPFRKKLAFTLEHGSSNNCTGRYRSVVYYYLRQAASNRFVDGVPARDMKHYIEY